jgi:hypothetical protein
MPEVQFAPPQWVRMPKHRRIGPRNEKLWGRNFLSACTGASDEPSIYDRDLLMTRYARWKWVAFRGTESNCLELLPTSEGSIANFQRKSGPAKERRQITSWFSTTAMALSTGTRSRRHTFDPRGLQSHESG